LINNGKKWRRFDLEPEKPLRLYGYWRSSASWRVRWALNLKEISFEYVPVNLLKGENSTPDFLRKNPAGAVPVLDLGDGRTITESLAIIEWIEEVFSLKGPSLFPGTAYERARVRQLSELVNSGISPLQIPKVQKRVSSDPLLKNEWAQSWIKEGLIVFDKLSRDIRKTFSVGDQLSTADICLIPQIYNAIRYEIDVEKNFPDLFRIYTTCRKLPSCIKADPENQIDAVNPN